MKNIQLVKLMVPLLGLALALGFFVADIQAQTAPAAPPAQQEGTQQPAPGATDRGTAPQPTTPETRGDRPPAAQPAPNVTVESRSETRTSDGGKILGVNATVAMVIGAVLFIVIVIALVAMSKRTEDVPTHRSV